MSHASTTPETAQHPATDPAADATACGLSMLDELAQIGMVFARALGRIAQAAIDEAGGQAPELTPQLSDAALAFSRVSRAVRMTVGLKNKILRERQFRADRLAAEKAVKDAEEAQLHEERVAKGNLRRSMTRFIVQTAIEAEEREADEVDELFEGLDARLSEIAQANPHFEDVHVKNTAYAIARDLGLDPGPEWWMDGWGIKSPPGSAPRSAGVPPATRAGSPRSRKDDAPAASVPP